MAFNVGDTAGDYQILSILGVGGMGKVYKARNIITDRVEALKVLLPDLVDEPELADRFMREIKLLASLNHPNIAGLHTALRIENQLLMVMEFVEGRTMEDRLKDGPLPAGEAATYVCQALSALGFAHERGIVHRDIKPANMMVTPDGQLKLMDFGIAKAVADRRLTMTGTTLGSLFYMSPEQVKGSSDLDGRSDLYSVGVSLYEMVTGTRPFKGDSDYSIMVAHLEQTPVPPIQIDPSLPPALNEIILTAIQKERENRFQSAQAFRAALESVAASLGHAQPVGVAPPPPQPAAPPMFAPPPPPIPTVTQQPPPAWQPQPPPIPQAAPAPPPQQAQWAPAAPVAPAAAGRSGHRGLWMALGGLMVLALLAVAAIQGPRLYRAIAGGSSGQTVLPQATPTPAPEAFTPAPQETATPAPVIEATPVPVASATPYPTPAPPVVRATPPPQVGGRGTVVERLSSKPKSVWNRIKGEISGGTSSSGGQQAPAVDTARIEQLRDQLSEIGVRANTIRASLQNLERQQQAAGYGLRGDISTDWKRMESLLDAAEAALNANNPDRAQKQLDLVEPVVDRLEKFLGR